MSLFITGSQGTYAPMTPTPQVTLRPDIDSYTHDDVRELVKQNVKMILLTAPGERIMMPEFGVGLKTYLFEPATKGLIDQIKQRSKDQLEIYAPAIEVNAIKISFVDNTMYFAVSYSIDSTRAFETLELTLSI